MTATATTNLSEPQRAIIAAMYHRTRKTWLEWGTGEIARRVNRSPDEISRDLRDLHRMGLIKGTGTQLKMLGAWTGWQATPSGRMVVAQ